MPPSKYVDMLTDFGFKRIFGDKELLISFLNALFEKEGKVIKSVRYLNKEITPLSLDERLIIYDVFCKVDKGEDFILEMQHKPQETFKERSLYYLARSIVEQGETSKQWNYKLHPVYGIFITNFTLLGEEKNMQVVREIALLDRESKELFSDKMRMFFINLTAFRKKNEDELNNNLERWIYNIKNMGTLTSAPRMASSTPFCKLYTRAEIAAMPKAQQRQYEYSLRIYRDHLMDLETNRIQKKRAKEEGLAEGRAEGRAEGLNEGLTKGLAQGLAQGRAEGLAQGRAEGLNELFEKIRKKGYPEDLIADLLK